MNTLSFSVPQMDNRCSILFYLFVSCFCIFHSLREALQGTCKHYINSGRNCSHPFMTIHRTFEHYRNQNVLEKDFKTKASFNLCSKIAPSLKSHDKNHHPAVKFVLEIPCSLTKPTHSS